MSNDQRLDLNFLKNNSSATEQLDALGKLCDQLQNSLEIVAANERKYREILELMPQVIFEIDSDLNMTFLNENAYKVTGYSKEDLRKGLKVYELIVEEERDRLMENLRRIMAGEFIAGNIYTSISKNGLKVPIMVYSSPIREGNKIIGARGVVVDVSEKVKAQRELESERSLIRSLLETANGLIVCLDSQARILIFNDECERITGYKKDEVIGKSWPEIFVPEKYHWPAQYTFEQWVKKQPRGRYEGPIVTKSGEIRDIFWSNSAYWGNNPDEFMAIAIGFDITEKNEAETALLEAEEKYQTLLEQSDDAVYLLVDGNFEFVNDRFVDMLGWSREELLSPEFDIMNLVSPKSHKFICDRIKAFNEGLITPKRYEFTALKKDGSEIELSVSLSHISYEGRRVIQGVYHDITERKRRQAALEESEERYRAIWENSPVGISLSDINGVYYYVNPAYCRIYGYSEGELIGKNFMDLIVVPEKRMRPPDNYRESFKTGKPVPLGETEFLNKKGERIWIQYTSDFIHIDGKPVYQVTMNVDISDRKKAEEQLKNSELRFKAQFKASPIPTYSWRKQGDDFRLADFNNPAFEITKGKIVDFIGIKLSELYKDRQHLIEKIERCFKEKTTINEEKKYLYKSTGEEKHLNVTLTYAPPDLVLVSTEDITQSRQTRVRNQARLNLLNGLRTATTIDECFKLGCLALDEAELYRRSVLTLHNEKREIINIGYYGLDDMVVQQARKRSAPDMETTGKMLQERFRISNSYFVPEESGLDLQKQGRYIIQTDPWLTTDNSWRKGDELFSPIVSDSGRIIGWLSVDTPHNGRRPAKAEISHLEELIQIVIKKTQSIHRLEELNKERQELEKKHIALKQLIASIKEDKVAYTRQIGETVEQVLLPSLQKIVNYDGSVNKKYFNILKEHLQELSSSSMGKVIPLLSKLSAREAEICQMIRRNMTSKEIAEMLHVTPGTIQKHREKIRKKLGITNKNINLATFLKNL
jgi:PAS domain S-box-containing protein